MYTQLRHVGVEYPAPAAIGSPVEIVVVESPNITLAAFVEGAMTCIQLARTLLVEMATVAPVPVMGARFTTLKKNERNSQRILMREL